VNMGVGEATQNAKLIDPAVNELGQITGQKPVTTRAKKSIAAFKVREGMPIGAMVTLRGDRMYEFFDRLVSIVLPRVRDFRGVSTKSFDGRGNYTLGLHDQLIFPEIDYARVDKLKGMNVTIVTTARSDDQARSLLKHLGCRLERSAAVSAALGRAGRPPDSRPALQVAKLGANLTTAKRVKDAKIEKKFDKARGKEPKPKFSSRRHNRCKICGRPRAIYESLACAVCVSGNWRCGARSPEFRSRLGKAVVGR